MPQRRSRPEALACVVDALEGGEPRPGQVAMAVAVVEACDTGSPVIVQAGTGTGKSLAYLVPTVVLGKKVLVATATKALQDQLATKDVPQVASVLGDFGVAVLKGRSNYVCHQKLDEMQRDADLFGEDEILSAVVEWADESPTGEIAEMEHRYDAAALAVRHGVRRVQRPALRDEGGLPGQPGPGPGRRRSGGHREPAPARGRRTGRRHGAARLGRARGRRGPRARGRDGARGTATTSDPGGSGGCSARSSTSWPTTTPSSARSTTPPTASPRRSTCSTSDPRDQARRYPEGLAGDDRLNPLLTSLIERLELHPE